MMNDWLIKENEDLGKMISSGRLAKLEGELAIQKTLSEEMKQSQLEVRIVGLSMLIGLLFVKVEIEREWTW